MLQEYRNHSKGHLLNAVERNVLKLVNETNLFKNLVYNNDSTTLKKFNDTFQFLSEQIEGEFDIVAEMYSYNETGMLPSQIMKLTKQLIEKTENGIEKLCNSKNELNSFCWEFRQENYQLQQFFSYLKLITKQLEETVVRHSKSVDKIEKMFDHK